MTSARCISSLAAALLLAVAACSGSDSKGTAEEPHRITASPDTVIFSAEGGTATIAVSASGEWDATSADSWLALDRSGTLATSGRVDITASPNSSVSPRTSTVLLMSGPARARVAVRQDGRAPEPVDTAINVPDGYSLVWHDEFDGESLDRSQWRHEVQGPGWVNDELQTYVDGSYDGLRVSEVSGGVLTLRCFAHAGKVYSARIYAREHEGWRYGIVEARIRLPKGKGTWPAFWMMPVDNDFSANPWPRCGEIDIMEEVGYNPDRTSSSIHTERYNHVLGTQRTAERLTEGAQDEFHVYTLEWTPSRIQTYVDGKRLLTFDNDGTGNPATWPFTRPFYVILNLAWGGSWGGAQGVDESCLPAEMQVDYVRVFQTGE